jgi:hypothetical protein
VLAVFMIFLIIFGFHASFLCDFEFLFSFLVKVGFMVYLRLCKPSKKRGTEDCYSKENKTCELGIHIYNLFRLLKFMCIFFICYCL